MSGSRQPSLGPKRAPMTARQAAHAGNDGVGTGTTSPIESAVNRQECWSFREVAKSLQSGYGLSRRAGRPAKSPGLRRGGVSRPLESLPPVQQPGSHRPDAPGNLAWRPGFRKRLGRRHRNPEPNRRCLLGELLRASARCPAKAVQSPIAPVQDATASDRGSPECHTPDDRRRNK